MHSYALGIKMSTIEKPHKIMLQATKMPTIILFRLIAMLKFKYATNNN